MEYHEEEQEEGVEMPSLNESPIETTPVGKGKYKECLKNHAVGLGGHAVDGCGEFIAAGALESLKCAACNCHRNFHRKENHHQLLLNPHGHFSYLHVAQRAVAPLALPSSSGGGGDEMEEYYYNPGGAAGKKTRFRTKFTQEQKEKMLDLAERLGWKIQKQDEELVHHFCNEMGLKRHVLKVWMHNNKLTLGKKTTGSPAAHVHGE